MKGSQQRDWCYLVTSPQVLAKILCVIIYNLQSGNLPVMEILNHLRWSLFCQWKHMLFQKIAVFSLNKSTINSRNCRVHCRHTAPSKNSIENVMFLWLVIKKDCSVVFKPNKYQEVYISNMTYDKILNSWANVLHFTWTVDCLHKQLQLYVVHHSSTCFWQLKLLTFFGRVSIQDETYCLKIKPNTRNRKKEINPLNVI